MQIDTNIYCLMTGKPIAQVSDDELGVVLASVSHVPSHARQAHIDRLVLSSMRPSLAWMSVTPQSVEALREAAPRELLAYLMNRMYAPLERANNIGKHLDSDTRFAACRLRINIWQSIESCQITDAQLDQILFVLLSLDSRFSLSKIAKPTAIVALWQTWTDIDSFLKELWHWQQTLAREQDELIRRAKFQADFWSEGNRHTRTALVSQFKKVTPPTPRQVERKAKAAHLQDNVDFLDQLERELTTRSADGPIEFLPAAKPVARITRFGGMKKDS